MRAQLGNRPKPPYGRRGRLRDVQKRAGHASLATTQKYIQDDSAAKRNVMNLI
jgi:integrase